MAVLTFREIGGGEEGRDHIAGFGQVVCDHVERPCRQSGFGQDQANSSPQVMGASSLGLITTVLPTANGMAIGRMPRTSGAFHGEIAPTTPNGTRWAIESAPGIEVDSSSPSGR